MTAATATTMISSEATNWSAEKLPTAYCNGAVVMETGGIHEAICMTVESSLLQPNSGTYIVISENTSTGICAPWKSSIRLTSDAEAAYSAAKKK